MELPLDPVEARVLGSLMEKEMTTPEYYPMTLNALTAACNQKSNRDPVVSYDEETVQAALESLRAKGLAMVRTGAGMRVPKYGERLSELLNLGRRESAVVGVLLLRGPQTLGELRERAGRMHPFSGLEEVESTLEKLSQWEPPLAVRLERQPGMKEPRYSHLLCGEPQTATAAPGEPAHQTSGSLGERVEALETEVERLREQLDSVQRLVEEFRRQFE